MTRRISQPRTTSSGRTPGRARTPGAASVSVHLRAFRLVASALALLLTALVATAVTAAEASTPEPEGVLRITVTDADLSAPDAFRPGAYRIHLHNETHHAHAVRLVRIEDGMSVAEAEIAWRTALRDGTELPDGLTPIDGPAAEPMSESPGLSRYLAPGTYLIGCDVPDRGGRHLATGELTVLEITDDQN